MATEKLIYVIEINTNDSVKSVKSIKDEIKNLTTALNTVAVDSENFNILNRQLAETTKQLQNVGIAADSLGAVKNEIKQITAELGKVKIDSPEYNSLIVKLGQARATLKDFKTEVKALDPDEKFKAFVGIAGNLQAGFNVASGALKLFGVENENVAAAIQQTTAAMEVLQALNNLDSFADNKNILLKVLGWKETKKSIDDATGSQIVNNAAVQSGVVGFKVLRSAIIATGIGILVAGLGEVVARWDEIKKAFGGFEVFKSLGKYIDETKARFVGAFYLIGNVIKPTAKLITDYFLTPIKLVIDSIKVLGNILDKGISIDNLKAGAKDIGNLFVEAKDKIVNDVKDIGAKATEGFQFGQTLEAGRQADAELEKQRVKETEKRIENNTRLLAIQQAHGENTYNLQKKILQDELSLLESGSKEYLDKQNEIYVLDAANKKTNADKAKKAAEQAAKDKVKAEADAEQKAKEEAEAGKKAQDDLKGQFEGEYKSQIDALNNFYDQEKLAILKSASTKEEADKQLEQLEKEKLDKLLEINKQFYADKSTEVIAVETELQDKRLEEVQKGIDAEKKLKSDAQKEEEQFERTKAQLIGQIKTEAQELFINILNQQAQRQYTDEINLLNEKYRKETDLLEAKVKKGEITEEAANTKRKDLEEKQAKEKRKIDRQAAVDKRTIALIDVAISTARNSIEQPGPLGALIPYWVALGLAEAAGILSQPLPALAKGGVMNDEIINAKGGNYLSNAKGTSTSDSNLALLSKGESVINAKSTAAFLPLLSEINEWGGGVKFRYATGGLNGFTSTATGAGVNNTTIFDNSRVESLLQQIIDMPVKAQVVASEVTTQQLADERIERRSQTR